MARASSHLGLILKPLSAAVWTSSATRAGMLTARRWGGMRVAGRNTHSDYGLRKRNAVGEVLLGDTLLSRQMTTRGSGQNRALQIGVRCWRLQHLLP